MCIRDRSSAGDFNGDGVGDTLVGAMFYDTSTVGNIGAAYLILGEPAYSGSNLGYADVTFTGTGASEWSGASVSGGGDVDGDGYDDLLAAAPYAETGSVYSQGAVYVFYGPMTSDLSAASADMALWGDSYNYMGQYSLDAYDYDNDGAEEVVVGAHYNSTGGELESDQSAMDLRVETEPQKEACLLYTSPSPRDSFRSRMPSSA